MKTSIQRILICLLFMYGYATNLAAQSGIDVLDYRFEIEVNDANDRIHGKAIITVLNLPVASNRSLDLASMDSNGTGMKVDSIFIRNLDKLIVLPQEQRVNRLAFADHSNGKLSWSYGQEIGSANDTDVITVYYQGIPADGLIISKNKYGKRTFFSDNWPNRARNWIPCVDDPADKASVSFSVIAPSHYQVISNGIQVEESDLGGQRKLTRYQETLPLPTKVMVIGVAEFAVNRAGMVNQCIPVFSWVYPEEREKGFYDYALTTSILSWFIDYVGPYPYRKLANVQSKTIFGGMENAAAIFYHENSVTGTRAEEDLFAHEIAHQWFGDMATEKSFAHLWLSEGFATYLTHVYLESVYGESKLKAGLEEDRKKVLAFGKGTSLPVVDTKSGLMDLLNANSYQKGGWVLHMLRRETGDAVFKKIIQTYYERFRGKNADTEDFRKVAEEISGKNLKQFFTQWLYSRVNPIVNVSWKYNAATKKLDLEIQQTQAGTDFRFPLEIAVQFSDGKNETKKIQVDSRNKKISIPLTRKPTGLVLDPNVSLLFDGKLIAR